MFKKLSGLIAIWCLLLLTGCLDYGQQTLTLTLPVSEKPYIANALDAVKSRVVVLEKLDIATAANAFVRGTIPNGKPPKP